MATLACNVSPEPPRSGLVDRIVGPDASEERDTEDGTRELTVSLAGLLDPKSWNLPGWGDAQYVQ